MSEHRFPSREDLKRLPRWARVAFAARCARRVQPLFKAPVSISWGEPIHALNTGISLAEKAAVLKSNEFAGDAIAAANFAANTASKNADAAVIATTAPHVTAHFSAAVNASEAAVFAAQSSKSSFRSAAFAVRSAYIAILDAADARRDESFAKTTVENIRHDYNLLLAATKKFGWTDDTPVPPVFFGAMWPYGIPEGWPEAEARAGDTQYALRVTGPPGEPAEAVVENTRHLMDLIDQLNRVEGGRGVVIDDDISVCDQVFFGAPTPSDPQPVGGGC